MVGTYDITAMADVLNVPLKTCLSFFATVVECQSLARTVAGGYFYNLTLACSSIPDTVVETCAFFSRRTDAPLLRSPGDVAFLGNARVQMYDGERVLKLDCSRGGSGLAFFDWSSSSTIPYAQAGAAYDGDADSDEILSGARRDAELWRPLHPDFYVSKIECRLDQLEAKDPSEAVDLSCKVVSVDLNHDPKLLWVWDATDVKPEELRKPDAPREMHLGSCFSVNCRSIEQPIPKEGEEELPPIGSIVPVAIARERRILNIPSGWIKLRNVICIRYCSQVIILHTDDTRWSPVPLLPSIHDRLLYRREEKLIGMHIQGMSVMSRTIGHPCVHAPLRAVNGYLHQARLDGHSVKKEFRCLVSIVRVQPDVDGIITMLDRGASHVHIEMDLQDATGRIGATLLGKHGWKFFGLDQVDWNDPNCRQERGAVICGDLRYALENTDPVPFLDVCLRVMVREETEAVQILDTVLISPINTTDITMTTECPEAAIC